MDDEEIYVLQVKNWTFRDMDGHVGFTRDKEFALNWLQGAEADHRDYRAVTPIREYKEPTVQYRQIFKQAIPGRFPGKQ